MLLDAHAHIDHYEKRLEAALVEIRQQEILTIAVAMDPSSYRRSCEIAADCDLLLPIFGVHPWRAQAYADRLDELDESIARSPMLGEIGLDYHWVEDASLYPAQRRLFEYFLAAARDQNKIVNLHTKGAEGEILQRLQQYGIRRSIVHWYAGPLELLPAYLDAGAYFTVGVELLCSESIRELARQLPLERLLTETDNPGGQEWLTGEIGMPTLINDVLAELARIKQRPVPLLAEIIRRNFLELIHEDQALAGLYDRIAGRTSPR